MPAYHKMLQGFHLTSLILKSFYRELIFELFLKILLYLLTILLNNDLIFFLIQHLRIMNLLLHNHHRHHFKEI